MYRRIVVLAASATVLFGSFFVAPAAGQFPGAAFSIDSLMTLVRESRRGGWVVAFAVAILLAAACDPIHRLHGTVFVAPTTGVVMNQFSSPLSGVDVTILEKRRVLWFKQPPRERARVRTDSNGRFDVTMTTGNFTVKQYILQFTKSEYETVVLDLGDDLRHHANVRVSQCLEQYAACQVTDVVMHPSR